MNKTKNILAGFAIFASILMLSTTCIASPVEQEASIEALEYAEQELINSIEAMLQEALNDPYVIELIAPLQFDNELNSLVSAIDSANDPNEKAALASSYFDVLKDKEEFTDLNAYLVSSNSDGVKNVNSKLDAFADAAGDCLTNAGSEISEIGSPMVFPPMPRFFLIELEPDDSEGTETQDGEDSGAGDSQTTGIFDLLDELIRLIINIIRLILITSWNLLVAIAGGIVWLIVQLTNFLNSLIEQLTDLLDQLNDWLEKLLGG